MAYWISKKKFLSLFVFLFFFGVLNLSLLALIGLVLGKNFKLNEVGTGILVIIFPKWYYSYLTHIVLEIYVVR